MSRESYRSEGRGRYQSGYNQNKTPQQMNQILKQISTPMKEKKLNDRIRENLGQNDY